MSKRGFKVGDVVISTPKAIKDGVFKTQQRGTVAGTRCHGSYLIRVLVDGRKSIDRYHVDFWRRAND